MSKQLVVLIELEPTTDHEEAEHRVTDALNETLYTLEAENLVYDWKYAR